MVVHQLKFVEYGSPEYYQATQLRYRLFYQEHNIPFASIFDSKEKQNRHLVITANPENKVLAYGRLVQNSLEELQIHQMVVEPAYQGKGLGKLILQTLIATTIQQGSSSLVLNARITKVGFYQPFGFKIIGQVFTSLSTGVLHIKMQKDISQ